MKTRYLRLAIAGLIVLGIHGPTWPMIVRARGVNRLEETLETEQLASSLKEMRDAAGRNLERVVGIANAVQLLRKAVAVPDSDPFVLTDPAATRGREAAERAFEPGPDSVEWPDLALLGVVLDGEKSMVLIDDGVYKKGDTVSGVRIVEIAEDRIVLASSNDERRALMLEGREESK